MQLRVLSLKAICLATLGGLTCCCLLGYLVIKTWPDSRVHILYCDVGQGDGVLITYLFTQVLIDSGPDSAILQCLKDHIPSSDDNIEVVISTHPDKDHMGGFAAVFRQYTVSHLYLMGLGKQTQEFKIFREEVINLLEKGTKLHLAQHGQSLALPGILRVKLLFPEEKVGDLSLFSPHLSETQLSAYLDKQSIDPNKINDVSIATLLIVGNYTHLLTADREVEGEQALLTQQLLTDVDVFKAGHHGSKTSNTDQLLEKITPEFIVISCGKNNSYGHPHKNVLDRLERFSSKVFRTDQQGTVEWISDGHSFQWKTKK